MSAREDHRIFFGERDQDFGPSGFSFAKSFRRHGGMRYFVLWLLGSRPMKGSEIMDEIQKQPMGWWRPSPGTIYPLLGTLEKELLVVRREDLRYELTEKGQEEIGLSRKNSGDNWSIERIIYDMESYVSYLEEEADDLKEYKPRIEKIVSRLSKLKLD